MKILITGGAGYIGAINAKVLRDLGHEVVILDSLIHGQETRVEGAKFYQGETKNIDLVKEILLQNQIEAVIHFAAFIEAGESMQNPYKYFDNNTYGSLQLLQAMIETNVKKLVFSSTAAVYGNPVHLPIKENDPKMPINAYGESKLMVEKMLKWFDQIYGLKAICLRYFNAAGAIPEGVLGECHDPETHLIPNIIKAILEDRQFNLFGNDYETEDGTCVRDYIHVLDLAQAHVVALQALMNNHASDAYNVGTGTGYSNKQILEMIEQVSGQKVKLNYCPRREGDPAILVADSSKLKTEFNWEPKYSDLQNIIQTAWDWHSKNK
ncbi:UDP-glucose 4-epimerase GalE [Candidatus Beckwithbacteria bacterium]|nr:UDP-glucose 4-epimerase GalE [Candidatus Beckwithbacteria bacterium]